MTSEIYVYDFIGDYSGIFGIRQEVPFSPFLQAGILILDGFFDVKRGYFLDLGVCSSTRMYRNSNL